MAGMMALMTSPDDVGPRKLPQREARKTRTLRIPLGLDIMIVKLAEYSGVSINEMFVFLAETGLRDIRRNENPPPPLKD